MKDYTKTILTELQQEYWNRLETTSPETEDWEIWADILRDVFKFYKHNDDFALGMECAIQETFYEDEQIINQ